MKFTTCAIMIMSAFFGCTLTAMKQAVEKQEDTQTVETTTPAHIKTVTNIGVLPSAVWKMIVLAAAHDKSLPSIFSSLVTLRSVNRSFNNVLHEEAFLQRLFSRVNQGSLPLGDAQGSRLSNDQKVLFIRHLCSYLGHLFAQNHPSEKDLSLLKKIAGNSWTMDELFDCLITVDITQEQLFSNFPLLQFATFCMALSKKEEQAKQQWMLGIQRLGTEALMNSRLSKAMISFVQDIGTLYGNELALAQMVAPAISSELSYASLQQALMQKGLITSSWRSLLQLSSRELLEFLLTFSLSDDQATALTACQTGDVAKVKCFLPQVDNVDTQTSSASTDASKSVSRKHHGCTAEVLDFMLLLALKSNQKDIALHIIAANPFKKRTWATFSSSGFYCNWMLCEALRLTDSTISIPLVEYIFSSCPQEFLTSPLIAINTFLGPIAGIITNIEEVDAWCTLLDCGLKVQGLPLAHAHSLMRAFFKEDINTISEELALIDDTKWLAVTPAMILAIEKNLVKTLTELGKNPITRPAVLQSKANLTVMAERANRPEILAVLNEL